MIAWIHRADLDLLVRKDREDAIPDVDDHLLIAVSPLDGEVLERPEIRLAAPCGGVAGIDMNRNQLAVRFYPQDEFAPGRAPLLAERRRDQPCAKEIAALRRPAVVD